jgi:hypothetical protein
MTVERRVPDVLARLAEHPLLVLAAAVASIASFAVAIFGSPFEAGDAAGDKARVRASSTPAASSPGSSSSAVTSPKSGDCLTPALATVPCTSLHRYEIIAARAQTCGAADLARYLGGHPGREILLVGPKKVALHDGGNACVVVDPGGNASAPAAGALATAASARWRRCIDERTDAASVACSVPHTSEFVGVDGNVAPDGAACRSAAETYMQLSLDRVSDRLAVAVIPTRDVADPAPRCLVRVLGDDNVLVDTLRRVGVKALPIVAE